MAYDFSRHATTAEERAALRTKPYDVDAARAKFLARIERAEKQHAGTLGKQGGSDLKDFGSEGIEYRPRLNGQHIYLSAQHKEEGFFETTKKKITGLFKEIREAVAAGHFDDQIKEALSSKGTGKSGGAGTDSGSELSREAKLGRGIGGKRGAGRSDEEIRAHYKGEGYTDAEITAAFEKAAANKAKKSKK